MDMIELLKKVLEFVLKYGGVVLGSSVVSALISSSISYKKYAKEAKLKRITDERKKWRVEIRDIVDELSKLDLNSEDYYGSLKKLLNKLKVRINSYGIIDPLDYNNDGHIWKLIKEINNNESATKEQIDCLIDYLSALLKFDWERAKIESSFQLFKETNLYELSYDYHEFIKRIVCESEEKKK